jgi:hypothetical protein
MAEEATEVKIARLEEKLRAAEKALEFAQNNAHVVVAEVLSILAILASVYSVLHR